MAVIAVLAIAVIALGYVIFNGGSEHKYNLLFQNASQLVPDNQVLIGGQPVGSVESIELTDNNLAKVVVSVEGQRDPVPMQKDENGVWTATVGPFQPDIYGYSLIADGVSLIDPSNQLMKPNLLFTQSAVHIPDPASRGKSARFLTVRSIITFIIPK